MEIITDERNSCIKLKGRLDSNTSNDLDQALMALPESNHDIIIDFSECPYMSSAGIRILLKTKKRLLLSKNELYLTGIDPLVYQVLAMAGLHLVFNIHENVQAALAIIRSNTKQKKETYSYLVDEIQYTYQSAEKIEKTNQIWRSSEIVSYHELGYSIGFGSLLESEINDSNEPDLFVIAENCSGFLSQKLDMDADFRIISDAKKTGILIHEALSFGHHPDGFLKLSKPSKVSIEKLDLAIRKLTEELFQDKTMLFMIVASFDKNAPSITLAITNKSEFRKIVDENKLVHFDHWITKSSESNALFGLKFSLSEIDSSLEEKPLNEWIKNGLSFENILEVGLVARDFLIENPIVWLFSLNEMKPNDKQRLIIETNAGFAFELHQQFLARLLYADSSKLMIEQLHGGYSAQTFRVASYDHEGRKMRPTVLKIAHRELIKRESERCQQFALPYIFNNSAIVLGNEYYGETGALRYNFVGIGGESSQLKWLTHYYLQADMEFLEPLFDKIFLRILKPWYGQPVTKTIFPFKDHDPTFTFFPHIYQTVNELFGVSEDEKYISVDEKSEPILNPYWFLKHEFARHREMGINYFTGICHGDLNMQNILLDENMNVYLIDFSETKPRSIISDFARLEAIFLIDNAPLENSSDMVDYLHFIKGFYKTEQLSDVPEITYKGRHKDEVNKNALLAIKMRKYALESVNGNQDSIPYYIALLEWALPIACYYSRPIEHKRLSLIVSSILCEKVMAAMPDEESK
ncbi:MAG: hypothetical protein CVT92_01810 [Bacteroidetes bacterium HGW-Bacteroidetes-1]|jgi:anti-anti-sigma factor|nr:MAG: hypothetical protein CVT92_01810 [Bacteroidetes bacterium HGW-Bacteroidetes-1]